MSKLAILVGYNNQIHITPLPPSESFPKYIRLTGVGNEPMFRRTHIRPRKDRRGDTEMEVYRAK